MPRGPRGGKRPADVIGNAVKVMRIATGMRTKLSRAHRARPCAHGHKTLRTAAGIESQLWSMEDVVRLVERREDIRSGAALIG
jgi:hypothetical protein